MLGSNGEGPDDRQLKNEAEEQKQLDREKQSERESIEHQFSVAIRAAAANLLRIVRGAGNPHGLLFQFQEAIAAAVAYQESHGHSPAVRVHLRYKSEFRRTLERIHDGELDRSSMRADGTIDRLMAEESVIRGALQMVASDFVDQSAQAAAGEQEFYDGLRELRRIREEQVKKVRGPADVGRES